VCGEIVEKRKFRIAFVTNNYSPYSGGVVSSIDAFVQELMSRGHEVLIITLSFLGKQHQDPSYIVRVPSSVRFVYNKNRMAIPWRSDAHVACILRKFKPDIVHNHHPFLLCQSALKFAKKCSIPTVFTYHTMYERYTHYVPLYQPLVKFVTKKIVFDFCSHVDHIIAPSSAVSEQIFKQGVTTPISTIASPLRPQFLDEHAKKAGRSEKILQLLLVSRLVPEKNVSAVLDVMSQLDPKKHAMTIVGYGPQEEYLRNYAYKTLSLSPNQVQFIIKPPMSELIRLYRQADLFLFPSTSDTQGLVLAESMAGGTPVVALDGAGQRDIIVDGENGFIVASKEQMVKKIKQISSDDDLLTRLQQGALKTAHNYTPEALTERLLEVYQGLL